jgi:uncharacterized coiled-coil DUF342 family protein
MTEKETPKTNSDMIRATADNLNEFFLQVASHLEALENELIKVKTRIAELEASNGNDNTAQ